MESKKNNNPVIQNQIFEATHFNRKDICIKTDEPLGTQYCVIDATIGNFLV